MEAGALGRRRRAIQFAVGAGWFLGPWLTWSGRRLFGLDLAAGELRLFGAGIPASELFTALVAVLSLLFIMLWITSALGRLWCGWLCPQSLYSDLADLANGGKKERKAALWGASLPASLATGVTFALYFADPAALFTGKALWALVIAAIVALITLADMIWIGRRFCLSVCPYGKLLTVLTDRDAVEVAIDPARASACIDCVACERTCPMGLKVREGAGPDCIRCASCVDACQRVLGKRGGGIVRFEIPSGGWIKGIIATPKSLALLLIAVALAGVFAWMAINGREAALALRQSPEAEARILSDGRTATFVTARISAKPGVYRIAPEGGGLELKGDIERIEVGQSGAASIKFAVVADRLAESATLDLIDTGGKEVARATVNLPKAAAK